MFGKEAYERDPTQFCSACAIFTLPGVLVPLYWSSSYSWHTNLVFPMLMVSSKHGLIEADDSQMISLCPPVSASASVMVSFEGIVAFLDAGDCQRSLCVSQTLCFCICYNLFEALLLSLLRLTLLGVHAQLHLSPYSSGKFQIHSRRPNGGQT